MQYLKEINKTVLKTVRLDLQWNTTHKARSLLSSSLSRVTQKFAMALNVHFIYSNSRVSTPGLQFDHIHNLPEGRRKSLVDFLLSLSVFLPLSLPPSDGPRSLTFALPVFFLLSRLWGLFISPRCKGSHFSPLPAHSSHPTCGFPFQL